MALDLSQQVGSGASSRQQANNDAIAELAELVVTPVNTLDDLPNPTTQKSGKQFFVVNDPDETLNGFHFAAGANVGQPAKYFID